MRALLTINNRHRRPRYCGNVSFIGRFKVSRASVTSCVSRHLELSTLVAPLSLLTISFAVFFFHFLHQFCCSHFSFVYFFSKPPRVGSSITVAKKNCQSSYTFVFVQMVTSSHNGALGSIARVTNNRVHPQNGDDACSLHEDQHWKRRHGFQCPLHPQQVIGWILLATCIFCIHTVLVPSTSDEAQVPLHGLFLLLSLCLLGSMLTVSLADCEDHGKKDAEEGDQKCQWCRTIPSSSHTKHCSLCNKCVKGFDHHCKWLNQCIGQKNYSHFLVSVTSASIFCTAVCILCIVEIIRINTCQLCADYSYFIYMKISPTSLTVVASVLLILSTAAAALLVHLCVFHAYIRWNGWTTYDYIKHQMDESAQRKTSYLVNKKKRRPLTHILPCLACYRCPVKSRPVTTAEEAGPTAPLPPSTKNCTLSVVSGEPSEMLQRALSSHVYIHPSLDSHLKRSEVGAEQTSATAKKRRLWMQRKAIRRHNPSIVTTAPSTESSSDQLTTHYVQSWLSVHGLLPPLQ